MPICGDLNGVEGHFLEMRLHFNYAECDNRYF